MENAIGEVVAITSVLFSVDVAPLPTIVLVAVPPTQSVLNTEKRVVDALPLRSRRVDVELCVGVVWVKGSPPPDPPDGHVVRQLSPVKQIVVALIAVVLA